MGASIISNADDGGILRVQSQFLNHAEGSPVILACSNDVHDAMEFGESNRPRDLTLSRQACDPVAGSGVG